MIERRSEGRKQPAREVRCRVNVVMGGSSWTAKVANLSTAGIGLLARYWLPAEAGLLVELNAAAGSLRRVLVVSVKHARATAAGEFLIGGHLTTPISDAEVAAFLA